MPYMVKKNVNFNNNGHNERHNEHNEKPYLVEFNQR